MKSRLSSLVACVLATGTAALAGCTAQVDSQYRGEPLATIRGSVVTGQSVASQVDAAVVWMTSRQQSPFTILPKMIATRVTVGSSFPSSFTLDLETPPPPEAEVQAAVPDNDGSVSSAGPFQGRGVWVGVIVAIAPGTNGEAVHATDIVGVDLDHVLVYFDHVPVAAAPSGPGDFIVHRSAAESFGVPPTVGYHLAKTNRITPEELHAALQCLTKGVCPHHVGAPDADQQSQNDWEYERCVRELPAASMCTLFLSPTSPQETTEDQRCKTLQQQASVGKPTECTFSTTRPENPAGFDDPTTVTLGKSIWELSSFGWFGANNL